MAVDVLGPNAWWTVKLFCIPEGSNPGRLLRKVIEHTSHETPATDGEILLQVREYEDCGSYDLADDWRCRLSKSKRVGLRAIELRHDLLSKLCQLRVFPGLWAGLELGNIQKHLSLHATEEMLCYLQHIHDIWHRITLGNPVVQQATDTVTVQALQLRAPMASTKDAEAVQSLMRSKVLFRRIASEELRATLQDNLRSIEHLIPSIKTFHENMKYLSVCMVILKKHVLGCTKNRTVYQEISGMWRPAGRCRFEVADGDFREISQPYTVKVAYQQLILSALRRFPSISSFAPRCEHGEEARYDCVDHTHLARFLHCAQMLGFNSERVQQGLCRENSQGYPRPESHYMASNATGNEILEEAAVERRCGRPFTRSFQYFRTRLYIPELLRADVEGSYPSTMFVQKDCMHAFFGGTSLDLSESLVQPRSLLHVPMEIQDTRAMASNLQPQHALTSTEMSDIEPEPASLQRPLVSSQLDLSKGKPIHPRTSSNSSLVPRSFQKSCSYSEPKQASFSVVSPLSEQTSNVEPRQGPLALRRSVVDSLPEPRPWDTISLDTSNCSSLVPRSLLELGSRNEQQRSVAPSPASSREIPLHQGSFQGSGCSSLLDITRAIGLKRAHSALSQTVSDEGSSNGDSTSRMHYLRDSPQSDEDRRTLLFPDQFSTRPD